jgi:lysophospholipase L1-like esterase
MLFDGSFSFHKPNVKIFVAVLPLFLIFSVAFYVFGIKKILFLLIPFLIAFLLLEIGLRIWVSNFASRRAQAMFLTPLTADAELDAESVYVPHHYTLYNLRPNFELPDGTKHNQWGIRDHRTFDQKNTEIRVVFIGGSTTYTTAIKDNEKIFSYRLEKLLNKHYENLLQDKKIQVINAGMPGATSAENLLRLIFFVSELKPDLVVIQHGLNDVWVRIQGKINSDFSNYRKIWSRPNYFKGIPFAYGLLHSSVRRSLVLTFVLRKLGFMGISSIGIMVTQHNIPTDVSLLNENSTEYFERNTRYMIAVCKSMGAEILLTTEAYSEKAGDERNLAMPEHNQCLADIATEAGVLYYDFESDMKHDDMYMPDGRHVSQEGSDLKADLFFSFFVDRNIIPSLIVK